MISEVINMTVALVELLIGLYFIGVSLPGLFANPVARQTLVQLLYGVVLVILAVIGGAKLL